MTDAIKQIVCKESTVTKLSFWCKRECVEPGYVDFLTRDRESAIYYRATQEERNAEKRNANN